MLFFGSVLSINPAIIYQMPVTDIAHNTVHMSYFARQEFDFEPKETFSGNHVTLNRFYPIVVSTEFLFSVLINGIPTTILCISNDLVQFPFI